MLTSPEKVFFFMLAATSLVLAQRYFRLAAGVIQRGDDRLYMENLPQRLWRAVVITITQRPVFRSRLSTSIMHAFVVWGFLFYVLVNAADLVEGYFDIEFLGTGIVAGVYRLIGDVLSVLILVGMSYLLVRRFFVKTPELTFHPGVKLHPKALKGIRRDSLIVGVFILVHVGARFLGETFWIALQDGDTWQPFAGLVAQLWDGIKVEALEVGEHIAWWIALGSITLFIPYFPYTKHMHLFMGPLNYFSRPERSSLGTLHPLDFEDEEREQFGAARLEHLHQTHLFDAFACIMCNRCQDACPAYLTGKDLSPSALEINKRYEIKDHMATLASGSESPNTLLDFAITPSAVWACTTCGACVDICPVGNEPMFDIIDIRRDQVLTQGEFPTELQGAFRGMENTGNPWQVGQSRMAWAEGLNVPTVDDLDSFEVLLWVGCAGSFEPRAQQTTRALVQILRTAGVTFAVLGDRESCTGDTARRAGNEYLFYEMAQVNIDMLNDIAPPRILVACPHCFHTLAKEYPQFGGHFEVVHHTTFIAELLQSGRLDVHHKGKRTGITYHDPCYLGRHNNEYDAARFVIEQVVGAPVVEMERHHHTSFCCGAGGAQFWKEEEHGTSRVNLTRFAEAQATQADTLAVGCPFCMRMFEDARQDETITGGPTVKDVAEIIAEHLDLSM
ncbi:MAG: (Fe-S)-binding protein [Anaerolineae bacterium]|nr:(Fe-S)-binding protein [Anaerolineae bacterium]